MSRRTLRIRLLGGFGLSVGRRDIGPDRWRLKKAAGLVKILALAPNHRLHKERVMDLLWPGLDAKRASNNLHRTLHSARAVLERAGTECLTLRGDLVELCPSGSLWVDVEAFEGAATVALRSGEPAMFRAAISLYAGDLLPEDLYEEWAHERAEDLRRLFGDLLLGLGELCEERGEYEEGIRALRTAVALEPPTDEGAHVGLMRLYALSGRRILALRQYERLRKRLSKEFDAEPSRASRRLYDEIRAGRGRAVAPPLRLAEPPARGNLPAPLTSFVGREGEIVGIKRSLSMTRLMTLTGAGGSGKTRLAMEVARDLAATYEDGAWLVELAPVSDPDLLPRAVATALGVREQTELSLVQALCGRLEGSRALVVLDNCEHLVDAAAALARDLLGACGGLTVLATSREPLGVPGEIVWPVPTLSLPDPDEISTVDGLMLSEAVRLFVERARLRLPAFELTGANADAVASVCRELDGLPLAIELSTARMGALAVEQVAERLAGSLGLLSGGVRSVDGRHRTLRATLDWSYGLLDEAEKLLFARLSVFAGGWPLEAGEVVGAGDGIGEDDVLDLLSRLVNKSVVVVEAAEGGAARYGMLEPVRRYARERLEESGEAEAARRRHAAFYCRLAEEVEPWLRGAHREVWLERLEGEYANLRTALDWALKAGEVDLGLWFGGALAEFWYMGGNLDEGRRWLQAALAKSADKPATPSRVKALVRAGWIAWEQGDFADSVALSEEGLELSRSLGDEAGSVAALCNLAWAALLADDLGQARTLAEEAVTLSRAIGDDGATGRALLIPGLASVASGDHNRALILHRESLALVRNAEDLTATLLSLGMGTLAYLGRGDGARAHALCKESLDLATRPKVANATAFQLQASAALAAFRGQPLRSARLWGAAQALRETIGANLSPVERRVYEPYLGAARQRTGEGAWREAWAEGKEMTAEEAVEYAASGGWRVRPRPTIASEGFSRGQPDGGLTGRQLEVAELVAGGLTNRQIASRLEISESTVANHVANILGKLGVASRSRIAVWASER